MSEIRFVVAAIPPHKPKKNLISLVHRYAMVSLATFDDASFIPSLVELEPKASPYSVDTMRKISRSIGPDKGEIFFIAGGDSLQDVKSWKESEKLLTTYNFIFVLRGGTDMGDYREYLPEKAHPRVRDLKGLSRTRIRRCIEAEQRGESRLYMVDVHAPDISATGIRDLASAGEDFGSLVPRPVYAYINKLQLYGGK